MMTAFSGLNAGTHTIEDLGTALKPLSTESKIAALGMLQLSEEQLVASLTAAGLSAEEAATAATTVLAGTSASGAAAGFKLLGASVLNAAKGFAVFMLTNPVGIFLLMAGAIFGAVKAIEALTPSFDKAKSAAENSRNEYQNTKSELENLNGELERTRDRINELETKKTLTLTEEAELTKLKAQNAELENQIKIKESLAKVQEKAAAVDARYALTVKDQDFGFQKDNGGLIDADGGGTFSSANGTSYNDRYADVITYTKKKQEELNDLLAKEKELSKEQARLANSGDVTSKAFKDNEKQIESLQKQKSKLTEIISENVGEIQTNYASLFDSNGEIIAGNEQVAKSCEELFNMIKDSSDVAKEIEDNINTLFSEEKFKGVKDQLVEAAKEGKLDAAMGDISGLSDELNKLGIPADKFKQSIQAIADTDLSDVEKQVKVLTDEFASGADADNEIESRLNKIKDFLKGKDEKDIGNFYDYIKSQGIDISQWTSKDLEYNWKVSLEGAGEAAAEVEALSSSLKLATADIENMKKAMTESNSATGLTADSIANIEAMFSEYDTSDLFNRTATGIHLNADALERLNEQYASDHAQSYSETLVSLNNQLIEAREKLNEMDKSDEGYEAQVDVVNGIKEQIAEVQNYAAAWQGVTNAYNEYVMAQSSGNERDSLAGVAKDKDTIKKTIDQGWGASDDVDAYFDLVLGENHPEKASEAWKQLNKDIGDTNHSLADYMATNKSGELQSSAVTAWYNDISKVAGEGFAKIEEDGSKSLDLTGNKAEILAQKFGTTTEYVTLLAQALSETGVNVDFGNLTSGADQAANAAEKVKMSVETARKELSVLQEAGKIDSAIDLDIDVNTASTDKLKSTLEGLDKVKIDAEVDPAGYAALEKLKAEVQKEYLIRINVETGGEIESAQNKIEAIKKLVGNDGIKVALKGDNGDQIRQKIDELQNMSKKAKVAIGFDVKKGDYEGALSKIKNQKISVPANIEWKAGETPKDVPDAKGTANFILGKSPKDVPDAKGTANFKLGKSPKDVPDAKGTANFKLGDYPKSLPTITQTVKVNRVEGKKAMGTMHFPTVAHKNGTMHNVLNWKSAYANGRVALDKDEEALVNELGTESLIRNGKWMLIPGGMHTEKLRKGDIILSAAQTKSLLKIGRANGHGRAYAEGTLGPAYARGSSKSKDKKKDKKEKEDKPLKKFQEWFAKLFDWIEIRLKRQTDNITNYTKKADAALKSNDFGSANANYRRAIGATAIQIESERNAAGRYQRAANDVLKKAVKSGLIKKGDVRKIQKGVEDGTLDIKKYGERMREVIKDYQTWADKAETAKNSIADLHDKIREYIKDLKDVREAQRKFKNDRIDLFDKIGRGGFANDNGLNANFQNSQIRYQNRQIQNKNSSYVSMTEAVAKDYNRVSRAASKAIRVNTRNPAKYNKALETAQRAIKQKKKIPASVLKTIRKYSLSTYERLYAYNLALDNVETTRLERAADYAANSAEWYKNVSTTYSNREKAINNAMSLNKNKAKVANGPIAANRFLNRAAAGYDNLLKNDRAEIRRFSSAQRYQAGKVMNRRGGRGYRFDGASSAVKKATNRIISSARKYVKTGKPIPPALLSKIANYYSKGYISQNFYDACINYNNAVEYKEQAQAQYEIDKVTAKQEKLSIGKEKFSNIEQYYTNAQNKNTARTNNITERQKQKTTRGLSLSKKDYDNLIKQSKTERKLLENEAAAIRRVIRDNLRNGLWTKNSQEYKDAVQRLREINNKIQECVTSQIEWNNAIEQIPFDRVDEMVEWLDAAANRYTSGVDLKKAQGKDLSRENYTRQISDNNKKIKQLTNKSALAMANYYKAMGNKNHVFGGKKAGDWLKLARDSQAEINKIRTENEKLRDDLRDDVYWRTYERMHEALDRTAKILGDISDLISSDMYFDENGNLTIFGTSQIANFVKQYENARDQVKAYSNDIKNLNKLYKNGQYTALEYREKLNEIQDKLLNSAGDMKKYLESIKNMYKDMAKSELDALYKLIDARNDALSKKKAYYDYDKSLRDKSKDIQELTAQIAALENIDTAEAKGKKAKLQAELSEKQEDLEDTIFNHDLDLSKDALSDLKKILDEQFDEKWEHIFSDLGSLKELLNAANILSESSTKTVTNAINQMLKFYGVDPVSTGVKVAAKYASGTKRVPKNLTALTNENGGELIVTKNGLITPLSAGDGVIPHDLTQRLYDMAMGKSTLNVGANRFSIPEIKTGDIGKTEITQNYGSLINIEGSADAATVEDLKNMKKSLLEDSYDYTSKRIYKGHIHAGGKRVV